MLQSILNKLNLSIDNVLLNAGLSEHIDYSFEANFTQEVVNELRKSMDLVFVPTPTDEQRRLHAADAPYPGTETHRDDQLQQCEYYENEFWDLFLEPFNFRKHKIEIDGSGDEQDSRPDVQVSCGPLYFTADGERVSVRIWSYLVAVGDSTNWPNRHQVSIRQIPSGLLPPLPLLSFRELVTDLGGMIPIRDTFHSLLEHFCNVAQSEWGGIICTGREGFMNKWIHLTDEQKKHAVETLSASLFPGASLTLQKNEMNASRHDEPIDAVQFADLFLFVLNGEQRVALCFQWTQRGYLKVSVRRVLTSVPDALKLFNAFIDMDLYMALSMTGDNLKNILNFFSEAGGDFSFGRGSIAAVVRVLGSFLRDLQLVQKTEDRRIAMHTSARPGNENQIIILTPLRLEEDAYWNQFLQPLPRRINITATGASITQAPVYFTARRADNRFSIRVWPYVFTPYDTHVNRNRRRHQISVRFLKVTGPAFALDDPSPAGP